MKIGTITKTKEILNNNQFFIKKKFGQNFLIDENILNKIVSYATISSNTCVIEIGAGLGSLTELLAAKANKVITYEIDKELIPILENNLSQLDNVVLINEDILKADVNHDIETYFPPNAEIVLVSNLPYYITTKIIIKMLENVKSISKYILMMQKEVAERITSGPNTKDYGSLSVLIRYSAASKKLFDIPNTSFIPKPDVTSSLLELDIHQNQKYNLIDEKNFFYLIRTSFEQRRKKLINNLVNAYKDISKDNLIKCLEKCQLDLEIRAENLDIDDFVKLSNEISRI